MIIASRILTGDDAVYAAAILAEVNAGHEDAANRLAVMCRLDDLSNEELEVFCDLAGVER
jgi:hypothetical protein